MINTPTNANISRRKVQRVNSDYDTIDPVDLNSCASGQYLGLHSYKTSTISLGDETYNTSYKNDQTLFSGRSIGDKSTLNSSKAKSNSSLKKKSKAKKYTSRLNMPFCMEKHITPVLKSKQSSITRNTSRENPKAKISYTKPGTDLRKNMSRNKPLNGISRGSTGSKAKSMKSGKFKSLNKTCKKKAAVSPSKAIVSTVHTPAESTLVNIGSYLKDV